MHLPQVNYIKDIKKIFSNNFKNCNVLEVGSLNVNGTIRDLFENCNYTGIDVGSGKDVDIVYEGQKFPGLDNNYDTVISCECMEHNPFYLETFLNMWRMTKIGGLIIMTCATDGRKEHGTRSNLPCDSPLTIDKGWDYYKNLNEGHFITPLNFAFFFSTWNFSYNYDWFDMYFYGIKRDKNSNIYGSVAH